VSFLGFLTERQEAMTSLLRTFVEYETPSRDKPAVDRFTAYLADLFGRLGGEVTMFERSSAGNIVRAGFGNGAEQALILCHVDTVWPFGELARRPFRIEDGKAFGPGVNDMKGGTVQAIFALQAIMAAKAKMPRKVVFLCTTDEEIGSAAARELIEDEAKKSAYVLVPEPSSGAQGAVKLTRKGWGMFDVNVTGRSAHAGNDHAKGINAVEEMARQVIKLQSMTDYGTGTTISVGEIRGGMGYNVIPDKASLKVDLRASTQAELLGARDKILGLTPFLQSATVSVTGALNRPPLEATPGNCALYQKAKRIAAELGFDLPGTHVGGVSDGNFTSALGVATLDGIGAVGDGAHALHEHLVLSAMAPRAALIAGLLTSES
jgi:glutamate carboxypeptidase